MERIDDQIRKDENIKVTPTPSVKQEDLTQKPAPSAYEGTAPTIVENKAAEQATPVQQQVTAPSNDYSQNLGGANADEYAPVQENKEAQAAADQIEIPIEQAPSGGADLDDILADLGIN